MMSYGSENRRRESLVMSCSSENLSLYDSCHESRFISRPNMH